MTAEKKPKAQEWQKFQAVITTPIKGKVDLPDPQGRKVQGLTFDLEINLKQFQKDNRGRIEELFLGNPVVIKMQDQDKSKSLQFTTYIKGHAHAFRGSDDDEVEFYKITILIFRRQGFDFDKLYDLQLERYVYVEIVPTQAQLDDSQGKIFEKKKDTKPKDENQGELGDED